MRFGFDPLSREFSNFQIYVFSMKTLGTVVWTDEIEMYEFSNENLLVDGGLRITAANDVIIQYNTLFQK